MKRIITMMLVAVTASFSVLVFAGTPVKQSELPKAAQTFRQHAASSQVSSTAQSQGVGITLSSPSFRAGVQYDQGFASGDGISDDFKLWLSRHTGLCIDKAVCRYRDVHKVR